MRHDERDTMFARMAYEKDSDEYRDYYDRKPDKKEFDDYLRDLPGLCSEGTATYDPVFSKLPDSIFHFLSDIRHLSEGVKAEEAQEINPEDFSKTIKKLTKYFGANLVGITSISPEDYYMFRGRHSENYGEKIEKTHKWAIVFAVEMEREMINRSPMLEELIEVTKGYLNTGIIGMVISYYLRALGYDSRNHMDGNYLMVAPLIAEKAGLGEIGRNGLLITREFGQRVRLGIVTTDMELVSDSEDQFGIKEFCEICGKCVKTCPGQCIDSGPIGDFDGKKGWKISPEKCYERWRSLGTDCGICLSTCPFSQEADQELVDQMKGNPKVMGKILKSYNDEFGIRPFIKKRLKLLDNEV